jgi:hypothetical protein
MGIASARRRSVTAMSTTCSAGSRNSFPTRSSGRPGHNCWDTPEHPAYLPFAALRGRGARLRFQPSRSGWSLRRVMPPREILASSYSVPSLARFDQQGCYTDSGRPPGFLWNSAHRRKRQAPNRVFFDIGTAHPHAPMPHGAPVGKKIVVVRREWMTRLADVVEKPAVVGW